MSIIFPFEVSEKLAKDAQKWLKDHYENPPVCDCDTQCQEIKDALIKMARDKELTLEEVLGVIDEYFDG